MAIRWTIQTPPAGAGALAVVGLDADSAAELDGALDGLGAGGVPVGGVRVRDIAGVDRGVVARWSPTAASLMPHASPAVLRRLGPVLAGVGTPAAPGPHEYPEAGSVIESHMLAALARASSPLAIDLLIDQPRRWLDAGAAADRLPAPVAPELDRIRNRLIDAPLVAAWGPPNVGKSTLVNALAGRGVSIVADEPGTTRDHVGVLLDLGGLVVRYADTPGVRPPVDEIEVEALRIARDIAVRADLLMIVGDCTAPPPPPPLLPGAASTLAASRLTVATRTDLGLPRWAYDVAVCAPDGAGLSDLVSAIRNRLVPPAAISDPRPWAFWPAPAPPSHGSPP